MRCYKQRYNSYTNGNRLTKTTTSQTISGTYDAQDRLLTYGNYTYSYTANGELESKTDTTTGEVTLYEYDVFGNLRKVVLPDSTLIEYVVDGGNRRVGKKVNGVIQRQWIYDGQLRPVAEMDGSGTLVSQFAYATHINVPDYIVKGATTYRVITDHLGSLRFVIDTATGTIAQRIDYDDWGNVLVNTAPDFTPFGFAGGIYDSQTKLVRFGARDYDAEIGRWTSKDPIGFGAGPNVYCYIDNEPTMIVDVTGTQGSYNPLWSTQWYAYYLGLLDFYDKYEYWRSWGHSEYPGEAHSSMRHCVVSCILAGLYGGAATRMAGEANEAIGFVWLDLTHLWGKFGRLTGNAPWAFQFGDFMDNERGIKCASKIKGKCETCQDCCVLSILTSMMGGK